jgi:hypothetical protein
MQRAAGRAPASPVVPGLGVRVFLPRSPPAPREYHSGCAAQNVCTSCSCPNRAEKSEKAQRRSGYDGIARREGQGERYIRLLAPLESPGIIAAIVDETAPANLCVTGVPTGNPIRLVSLRESVDACGR